MEPAAYVEAKDGGDARAAVPLGMIKKLYKVEQRTRQFRTHSDESTRLPQPSDDALA